VIDINEFDAIRIGLASPEQIRAWSSVRSPNRDHQLSNAQTEKDGLFCERIFGPTKDWDVTAANTSGSVTRGSSASAAGWRSLGQGAPGAHGHIDLAAPVSHIWYFKACPAHGLSPGYLSKQLERVSTSQPPSSPSWTMKSASAIRQA